MIEKIDLLDNVGPINIGKQERVKIEEIAKIIIKISNKEINIEFDKTKKTVIWGQWCDCSEASRILDGWKAKTSFEDGLGKVYLDIQRRLK